MKNDLLQFSWCVIIVSNSIYYYTTIVDNFKNRSNELYTLVNTSLFDNMGVFAKRRTQDYAFLCFCNMSKWRFRVTLSADTYQYTDILFSFNAAMLEIIL